VTDSGAAERSTVVTDSSGGWVHRLAAIGTLPSDTDEQRLRKAVLTMSSTLMASLALVWVITYALLGQWTSAAIPFAYQVASAVSIVTFSRTRRYRLFRRSQLCMTLLLPIGLQWSLGGFGNSSAVGLWAVTCPLGALLFVGARQAAPWFAAFVGLIALSGAIDPTLAAHAPEIPDGIIVTFFVANILGVTTTTFALLQYFVREREREQANSERLLLNVLPEPVAARLKRGEEPIADSHVEVTVLFADIVGFTPLAERLPAGDVVDLLNQVFGCLDGLAAEHGVEKIKTIGDSYMAVAGVPVAHADHSEAIARMALAMGPAVAEIARHAGVEVQLRIGIATGAVVAGVIGRAKFSYDLWGDTVNTASRMESHAQPGTIQVTEQTHARLCDRFEFGPQRTVEVKGKGLMTTYLLLGQRTP
jgi:class 3 adenylate cyclase